MLSRAQSGHGRIARCCWRHPDTARALNKDIVKAAVTAQHMLKIAVGRQSQQDIHITQPQSGIEHHHTAAPLGQRDTKVDGYVAFPYSTLDRKSTRLNSSHVRISYAVFCLKKKT